ncbi:MAG: YciC family protein [Steroidobacteraceae bacterium]
MYVKPTAPRSIREVFDDAIRIYKGTGRGTWMLALALELVAAAPWLFWQQRFTPALSDNLEDATAALSTLTASLSSPAVWLSTLIAVPINLILYVALIAQNNGIASGRAVSAGAAVGVGVRLLPRMLLLGLLFVCIVAVGLILLVVPGIYWAGTLLLAFVALVVEDASVSQSMAHSRGLIKGRWWRAATLVSYVVIIDLLAYLAVTLITAAVAWVFGVGAGMTLAVSQLLSVATDTLIAPLYLAVYVAMYYELKVREAAERSMAKAV